MSKLKLEDLLEDLRDDGVIVSSGGFTLDPSKAEEKLRDFSFPSPDDYILKLIQFAVASHATKIDIESTSTKLSLTFDGEPTSEDDMTGIMAHLLNDGGEQKWRRLRHLAAGLRGAASVKPNSVCLQYWNGEVGFQRIWDAKGWRSEPFKAKGPEAFHRFLLSRNFSQTLSSAGEEMKSLLNSRLTPEEQKIQESCLFSPAELVLEGKPLARAAFGRKRYPGYDIKNDPNPGECKPPPYLKKADLLDGLVAPDHHYLEHCVASDDEWGLAVPDSEATFRWGVQPGEDKRCRAWLALTAELAPAKLVFVEDGVTLSSGAAPFACPGLYAVLDAHTLNKDLTGFQLVKDDRYSKMMEWLELEALRLRKKALESLAHFPTRNRVEKALKV